jgi:hypothetical protein
MFYCTEWLIRNALTEADKHDGSWQKYVITDCYSRGYAAGQGLASRAS